MASFVQMSLDVNIDCSVPTASYHEMLLTKIAFNDMPNSCGLGFIGLVFVLDQESVQGVIQPFTAALD